MPERKEILLGNGCHTLFSDEVWYLLVVPDPYEIILEARFDSDAPDRSGVPNWITTEFCVFKRDAEAVCRISFGSAAELLATLKLSFVPDFIWAQACMECKNLVRDSLQEE